MSNSVFIFEQFIFLLMIVLLPELKEFGKRIFRSYKTLEIQAKQINQTTFRQYNHIQGEELTNCFSQKKLRSRTYTSAHSKKSRFSFVVTETFQIVWRMHDFLFVLIYPIEFYQTIKSKVLRRGNILDNFQGYFYFISLSAD